jgi:hypothetical protein
VVHANGSVRYYRDGVRHREGGPACVYVNGTEKWYLAVGSAALEDQAATCRPAAKTHQVAMAKLGKARSDGGSRAEAVVDCVGDRRQQLLGLGFLPLHRILGFMFRHLAQRGNSQPCSGRQDLEARR